MSKQNTDGLIVAFAFDAPRSKAMTAVRIRRSSLLEYLGVEVRPLASKTKPMSEFDRIFNKYH